MDSLYSRYANALLSIAIEEDKIEFYKNEVKMLKELFKEDDGFIHLISSYFIEFSEKEKIIDKVYTNNENIKNFIKVIIRNNRATEIDKIFREFIKLCNEELKIKDGIIYSVNELTKDEIERIEKGISKKLNCTVELENYIDEKLIGGVKVIVEDKIFDGSVKNKLEKMKESLIKGGN